MAPISQAHIPITQELSNSAVLKDDSIVISGMSGMYPEARDVKELADILYNKENPLTKNLNSRWQMKHPELSQYVGVAPDVNRFDSQFFTVNYNLAQTMDPMSRKLLEHTFQAIYDAGLNPASLNGKKVAVFIGSSISESEKRFYHFSASTRGLGIVGSSKTMFANRISYWLNAKGPSLSLDEADCSSTTALEQAYLSLRRGECEAAIVGGAQLCLSPHSVIHYSRVGILNGDGTVKSYAEDANGYVLSDAINILFLQKAKDALRVYAELLHVKNEYVTRPKDYLGSKIGYINNSQTTATFIKDFYNEVQVSPQAVEYVEGYGTAIPDADKCELEAIAAVYCKDRTTPLLVGSVTSNIGLTLASSGIAGITKVLLGYHKGKIAANLNCERPRKDVTALRDGQMRIVTDHQPFHRTYAAVNSLSVTGIRSHVLLYGHYKPKDLYHYATSIPYLVTLSARQEPGVVKIFEYLKSQPIDAEEIALLHNIHSKNISGHLGRGYIVLDTNSEKNTVSLGGKSDYFNGVQRPLWFVYSGMGSQWSGMGAQLMQIPIFASAIERTERWVSTSVPQDKWSDPSAKYCSAEYHTNNLLNPVLFEETLRLIPRNAVLVEVAPHSLLQAILKRAMPIDCKYIPLTKRRNRSCTNYLLQAVGNIYLQGFAVKTQALYPKVEFPVSTKTPMLSHLVHWMHSEDWYIAEFDVIKKERAAFCKFVKSIHDNEYKYLQGHVIRRKMCYPFAAALVTVWDMFAMHTGLPKQKASITFKEVYFYAQPLLFKQKALRLTVSLNRGIGRFEVRTDCSRVVSGYVTQNTKFVHTYEEDIDEKIDVTFNLTAKYIYQLLNDRGYNYSGDFRSIECSNASLSKAAIVWNGNWVTFIDGMLQLNVLRHLHDAVSQLTYIREMSIDVKEHFKNHIFNMNGKNVVQADVFGVQELTRCGGVTLRNIRYRDLPVISHDFQKVSVTPYTAGDTRSVNTCKIYKSHPQQNKIPTLMTLECSEIGNLNTLRWVQNINTEKSNEHLQVAVHFAGLNKMDVKKVSGIITNGNNITYGIDYSGITNRQVHFAGLNKMDVKKVSGIITNGNNITYGIDYSGITNRQVIKKYIGNSRDSTFADMVRSATQDEGCEIVISNVKGDLKNASLKCCKSYGIVIDTVQVQDQEIFEYGMYNMSTRCYLRMDFSSIFTQKNDEDKKLLQSMVSEGIAAGYVIPISRVTYELHEVGRAYKLLERDQHCGKVLLRVCDYLPQVQHRFICAPDQCQVLFWDHEVFGVQVAEKLIHRGARNLHISTTSLTPYQSMRIRTWENLGIKIGVSTTELIKDIFRSQVLKNVIHQGSVEGIYVVLTTANSYENISEIVSALDNLDSMSRLLCQQLKHFTVVSTVKAIGEKMCLSRVQSGLTATWLDLSNINMDIINTLDLIDAVEKAQCSPDVTFIAQTKQDHPSLFDQVIAMADIKIPQHVGQDVTLQQLGLASERIELICTFLNITYNLSLEEWDIPTLTLEGVRKLEKAVTDMVPLFVKGIATLFSDTYSNELLATAEIIVVPSLAHNVFSIENDFDITGQYLCIVPGIEGHHERFRLLCERLKLPTIVLQPGLDHPYETVKQTAARYAEILSKKTELQDKFYILGYETGAMVAMELAAILENQGLIGTVFFLGCAPNEVHLDIQEQLQEYLTEKKLQDAIVRHIYRIMSGEDPVELDEKLGDISSWTKKVELCIYHLVGRMNHSIQFVRGLMEATLARLMEARRNTFTVHPLRSKVVVLRAATTAEHTQDAAIQQLSQQAVSVHQLQLPLSHAPTDMQCPALINQYLDDDILEEFKNKNLCESYVMQII